MAAAIMDGQRVDDSIEFGPPSSALRRSEWGPECFQPSSRSLALEPEWRGVGADRRVHLALATAGEGTRTEGPGVNR
jgi:hypothetical protein